MLWLEVSPLVMLLLTLVLFLQVFFCVMVGSFSLGNAAPNIGTLFGAKGAAAVVFEIIDNVSFVIN